MAASKRASGSVLAITGVPSEHTDVVSPTTAAATDRRLIDPDDSGASGVDDRAGLDQRLDAFSGYTPISEDLARVLAGVGRGAAERR